jgi:hypothetical protein
MKLAVIANLTATQQADVLTNIVRRSEASLATVAKLRFSMDEAGYAKLQTKLEKAGYALSVCKNSGYHLKVLKSLVAIEIPLVTEAEFDSLKYGDAIATMEAFKLAKEHATCKQAFDKYLASKRRCRCFDAKELLKDVTKAAPEKAVETPPVVTGDTPPVVTGDTPPVVTGDTPPVVTGDTPAPALNIIQFPTSGGKLTEALATVANIAESLSPSDARKFWESIAERAVAILREQDEQAKAAA